MEWTAQKKKSDLLKGKINFTHSFIHLPAKTSHQSIYLASLSAVVLK